MNIFDFAMEMEKDGERYYRDLAGKTPNKGLKNILNMLADEEVKHFETMRLLKNKSPKVEDSAILSNVKNIFARMKEAGETIDTEGEQISLYKKAQELEKRSADFYEKQSKETQDKTKKEIFLKLTDEEKKHYFILENIIEFISKPKTWLEDAEFNHLEEY